MISKKNMLDGCACFRLIQGSTRPWHHLKILQHVLILKEKEKKTRGWRCIHIHPRQRTLKKLKKPAERNKKKKLGNVQGEGEGW